MSSIYRNNLSVCKDDTRFIGISKPWALSQALIFVYSFHVFPQVIRVEEKGLEGFAGEHIVSLHHSTSSLTYCVLAFGVRFAFFALDFLLVLLVQAYGSLVV